MGNFVRTVGELGASMNLRIIHLLTNLYSTSDKIRAVASHNSSRKNKVSIFSRRDLVDQNIKLRAKSHLSS